MEIRELIMGFSKSKPEANVIIGYGSKVKIQANDKGFDKQIDLIFGVENSNIWHKLNYEMNPSDYKSKIGYQSLPTYENLGTKINYLSYLPFEDHMFKIGVVDTQNLIDDLIFWRNFFLAGRFQKPIEIIKSSDELNYAIDINRMNALKIALLATNKNSITEYELFNELCSLSFIGDWRKIMHIETKDKVKNIVEGSFDELHKIYRSFNNDYYSLNNDKLIIDYEKILLELDSVPENLRNKIFKHLQNQHIDDYTLFKLRKIIFNHFIKLNIITSAIQPLKGIALNGFSKTITYLNQKLEKK